MELTEAQEPRSPEELYVPSAAGSRLLRGAVEQSPGEQLQTETLFTQKCHKCVQLKSAADDKKCFCVAHP